MRKYAEAQLEIELSNSQILGTLEGLEKEGIVGILHASFRSGAKSAGLDALTEGYVNYGGQETYEERPSVIDVFVLPNAVAILRKHKESTVEREEGTRRVVRKIQSKLLLAIVTGEADPTRIVDQITGHISKLLKGNMGTAEAKPVELKWKPLTPVERGAEVIRKSFGQSNGYTHEPAKYSLEEAKLAAMMANPEVRALLLSVTSVGGARLRDAVSDGRGESPAKQTIVSQLCDSGLFRREFTVLCRKDGRALTRVADRSDLEREKVGTHKCAVCNRPLADELVEDFLSPTDTSRQLTNNSRWMRIIVAEELRKQGVEPTSILWNLNQGGEDIDIVFGLRDDVFFLELKDRAFGVGDAYPFNYRLQNWGGTFGIVFSTDRVAEEAKAVFARDPETAAPWARVQPPLVEFVEGCETLGRRLTEIIDARDLLWLRRRFLGEFPELNINSIIRGHIKRLSGSRPGDATVVSTPAAEIRG